MIKSVPVEQQNVSDVFDLSAEERVSYLQHLGVKNATPPLEHSPCLRNKKSGLVLPWNPMLAEQRDIMECCDATGNTAPEAWKPLVLDDNAETSDDLMAAAMAVATTQRGIAQEQLSTFHPTMDMSAQPAQKAEYDEDAVPYEQIDALLSKAEF